jgi:CheY-like chemotaxis protein
MADATKKTILIVEDDEDIYTYYHIILSELDVNLVKARDGVEALAAVDSGERLDLILLDIVLPRMSGEEFFRILRRERASTVPVILCSVDQAMVEKLKAIGEYQGRFVKGSPSKDLTDLVTGVMGG